MLGIFPGRGSVTWRDWYTHAVVQANSGTNTTLDAPLSHINVHIRDGSALLLFSKPAYTTVETRAGPYSLLVSQAQDGYAFGTAYIDDGESIPPTPSRTLEFRVSKGQLKIVGQGDFEVEQALDSVTILGTSKPSAVNVQGEEVKSWQYIDTLEKLVISELNLKLNNDIAISWE